MASRYTKEDPMSAEQIAQAKVALQTEPQLSGKELADKIGISYWRIAQSKDFRAMRDSLAPADGPKPKIRRDHKLLHARRGLAAQESPAGNRAMVAVDEPARLIAGVSPVKPESNHIRFVMFEADMNGAGLAELSKAIAALIQTSTERPLLESAK